MKDLSFLKENLIAHRGYHDDKINIPENSILAFERAIQNNFLIELDVHILKDGNIVVFHDDNLGRMTGINKNIKDATFDEIKSLKLKNTECTIPLLKEVLDLVDDRVPIIIELKTDVKCFRLEKKLVQILKEYKGRYCVKSFSPFSVLWFKLKYPNTIRGQLAADFENDKMWYLKKIALRNMYFNFFSKPDFISYAISAMPSKAVQKFKNKNKLVLGWTVRDKKQFEKGKMYCDNLICENFSDYM